MKRDDIIKISAAGLGLIGAVVMALTFSGSGSDAAKIYFYDESEKKLYAAPEDAVPPIAGIGGPSGDGVRAIVMACPGDCGDESKRKIVYLLKYTPELKDLKEKMQESVRTRTFMDLPQPGPDFMETNTLVRSPDEANWHPIMSPEGRKLVQSWQKTIKCPKGSAIICEPK